MRGGISTGAGRWTASLLLLGATASSRPMQLPGEVEQAGADELAFVEVVTTRPSLFVGERTSVRLRFGVQRELLEVGLLQPFQQRLDLPLQIETGWQDDLIGVRLITPPQDATPDADGRSYVLDDGRARALRMGEIERQGRVFTTFETALEWVPLRPGELAFPAPRLRFSYATRFREDSFRGPLPQDRRSAVVRGAETSVNVLAPPERGRPLDFCGWVGQFGLLAHVESHRVALGASLRLRLTIDGLAREHGKAPPPIEVPGWRVAGATPFSKAGQQGFTYDLAPLDAQVRELPPISLVTLDPGPPPRYVTSWTEAIAVEVFDPEPGAPPTVRAAPELAPTPLPEPSSARGPSTLWLLVIAAGTTLLVLFTLLLTLRRGGRPARTARARQAAQRFRTAMAAGAEPSEALAEYLGAQLDRPASAIIGTDLTEPLVACGLPPELSLRAAGQLERAVDQRYAPFADDASCGDDLQQLVEELERALRSSTSGR